jgi:TonB family protein
VTRSVFFLCVSAGFALAQQPTIYTVGGDVVAPSVLKQVEPGYTIEARVKQISGEVLLSLVVNTKGEPQDIHVTQKLGYGLDEKAIEALKKWRFRPGTKSGQPVAVRVTISTSFELFKGQIAAELAKALPGAVADVESTDAARRTSGLATIHQAAGRGVPEAQFFLGGAYDYGQYGINEHKELALTLFRACAPKLVTCQFRLGRLLLDRPDRTTQHYVEAYVWLETAAERGSEEAKTLLTIKPPAFTPQGRESVDKIKATLPKP